MSNPTEPLDLDRLEALARAATPGPWGLAKISADEARGLVAAANVHAHHAAAAALAKAHASAKHAALVSSLIAA